MRARMAHLPDTDTAAVLMGPYKGLGIPSPCGPSSKGDTAARHWRRITRDRLGDYTGAVQDFSAAIMLDPRNADFYHNRGFSQRKQA